MKKQYGFHTNVILNTMCMMVDVDYQDIDMQEDNWYFKHTWDEETEKEFKTWMINYIHKLKDAQFELYQTKYMKKPECERAVDMFMVSYGWCHKQPQWYLDKLNNNPIRLTRDN